MITGVQKKKKKGQDINYSTTTTTQSTQASQSVKEKGQNRKKDEASHSYEKIIDNPDEALKFFVKLISKKGVIVEKYIHSEDVAKVFDKRAFKSALELEAPDLIEEELVKLQKERLEELSTEQKSQQSVPKKKRRR